MSNWLIKNNNIDFLEKSKNLGINPIIGKLLANRGIGDEAKIKEFLNVDLENLNSSSSMLNVKEASEFLQKEIESNKKIRIVGDYDVDGIISTYVLLTVLEELGALVDYEIPNRIYDGYGINKRIIKKASEDGISTIITCDNGISAIEEAKYAKELGINLIVTDHHDLAFREKNGERELIIPEANFVINPKNPECNYPYDKLCGAGVAYKLLDYLAVNLFKKDKSYIEKYLEYIAIATIADVVELKDENRAIVKYGLELLNNTNNLGLKTLIDLLEIKTEIGVYHIGFIIGPTLNAAGRLSDASKGVKLLRTKDPIYAGELGKFLKNLNDERKSMTETGINNIIEEIESSEIKNDDILVVYNDSIHESIAGIIAGRIKDKYYKPTIVLTDSDEENIKGSARSIDEYNMFEGLVSVKETLEKFGGHPMAAGLSLKKENLEIFRSRINSLSTLSKEDLTKKYYIDLGLPIDYVDFTLIYDISKLEPYGVGNPKPIFGDKGLKIRRLFKFGNERKIIKFIFESEKANTIDAILFNGIEEFEEDIISKYGKEELQRAYNGENNNIKIDIIYNPTVNEYRGKTSIQLIVENYRL